MTNQLELDDAVAATDGGEGEPHEEGGRQAEPAAGPRSGDGPVDRPATDGRTVYVPVRLYKTITIFSTLFAIVGVVLGFVLLDQATDRARADVADIDPVIALVGLGCIVLAAAIYWFATRFQVASMGKAKERTDEDETDTDG